MFRYIHSFSVIVYYKNPFINYTGMMELYYIWLRKKPIICSFELLALVLNYLCLLAFVLSYLCVSVPGRVQV